MYMYNYVYKWLYAYVYIYIYIYINIYIYNIERYTHIYNHITGAGTQDSCRCL